MWENFRLMKVKVYGVHIKTTVPKMFLKLQMLCWVSISH
jgi:hypothetical protein